MQFLLSKSLRRLSKLYSKYIAKALPELHLEYYADIILLVASGKTPITPKEIAHLLQLDKSRVAILVDGLHKSGLVYTEKNTADRRAHFVFLTTTGKALVPKIQEAIDQLNCVINRELDSNHLECFYIALFQMQMNLTDTSI